jgi:hypothetical protein
MPMNTVRAALARMSSSGFAWIAAPSRSRVFRIGTAIRKGKTGVPALMRRRRVSERRDGGPVRAQATMTPAQATKVTGLPVA